MSYTKKKWIDHITDSNGNIIQQGTPISATNLNTIESGIANAHIDIGNNAAAIREAIPSGMTKLSTIDYSYMATNPNKIKLIGGGVAFVNGFKVDISDATIIDLGTPPVSGEREDLVFLEVWKAVATDTLGEVINSRIRTVAGVDFSTYSEGINHTSLVKVWGGNTSDTVKTFSKSSTDTGLYIAGTGSADIATLKTADGYVYAIPLFKVKRRNSGGYGVSNPNGGILRSCIGINRLVSVNVGSTGQWCTTSQSDYDSLIVGGYYMNENRAEFQILSKDGDLKFTVGNLSVNQPSGITSSYAYVDRIDKLFANIIAERDMLDLRHQVSLTGFNYQSLLEENFDKLLRAELQTKEKTKMKKIYHGIPKTPIDVNTIFYASLDGTTTAEVGGATGLTGTYKPMFTGLALKKDANSGTDIAITLGSEGTIDMWLDCDYLAEATPYIFTLGTYNGNTLIFYNLKSSNILRAVVVDNSGTTINNLSASVTKPTGIHHFRITFKQGNPINLFMNGVLKSSSGGTYNNEVSITTLRIGNKFDGTRATALHFSDFSISNIDRGSTFAILPADFISGYADIMPSFSGQRKVHSDALTSYYSIGVAKGAGSGHSKGITATQATPGTWASGDTIKVKGLAGEIISGVIDSDTALARVIQAGTSSQVIYLDDVSKFAVNDTIKLYTPSTNTFSAELTVNSIDTTNKTITVNTAQTTTIEQIIIETTASTSSPVVKFNNAGIMTTVTGTWSNLGTNEATFTLGTTTDLDTEDIQIEYSLNMIAGQGGIPVVYSKTLAGEANGKKLIVGTTAVRDDFKNKVVGDNLPMSTKYINASSLQNPSSFSTEVANGDYTNMAILGDSNTYTVSTSVNGETPQVLISIDVVKEVEVKFGTIDAVDKVSWIKNNINKIIFNAYVMGSYPSGNKVYFTVYNVSTSAWSTVTSNNTANIPTLTTKNVTSSFSNYIDDNGYIHFLAYTDVSDGVTPSSITIDYASIEIELKTKTDYDMLVPENPRRDDGKAGVLLVRKETKEIESYFGAVESDGIVSYGDYVPYQDSSPSNSGKILWHDKLKLLGMGTNITKYSNAYNLYVSQLPLSCLYDSNPQSPIGTGTVLKQIKDIDVDMLIEGKYILPNLIGKSVNNFNFTLSLYIDGSRLIFVDTDNVRGTWNKMLFRCIVCINNELYLLCSTHYWNGNYSNWSNHSSGTSKILVAKLSNKPLIKG